MINWLKEFLLVIFFANPQIMFQPKFFALLMKMLSLSRSLSLTLHQLQEGTDGFLEFYPFMAYIFVHILNYYHSSTLPDVLKKPTSLKNKPFSPWDPLN